MDTDLEEFRELVDRVVHGSDPAGRDFDVCRELLRREPHGEAAFQALCMLLEGALTRPDLPVHDAGTTVGVLRALAEKRVEPRELL